MHLYTIRCYSCYISEKFELGNFPYLCRVMQVQRAAFGACMKVKSFDKKETHGERRAFGMETEDKYVY